MNLNFVLFEARLARPRVVQPGVLRSPKKLRPGTALRVKTACRKSCAGGEGRSGELPNQWTTCTGRGERIHIPNPFLTRQGWHFLQNLSGGETYNKGLLLYGYNFFRQRPLAASPGSAARSLAVAYLLVKRRFMYSSISHRCSMLLISLHADIFCSMPGRSESG